MRDITSKAEFYEVTLMVTLRSGNSRKYEETWKAKRGCGLLGI